MENQFYGDDDDGDEVAVNAVTAGDGFWMMEPWMLRMTKLNWGNFCQKNSLPFSLHTHRDHSLAKKSTTI